MLDSFLFATSFIRDETAWLRRYRPWIDYYLRSPLARLPLVLIDDGSPFMPQDDRLLIVDRLEHVELSPEHITIFRFPNNLGRSSLTSYPGWWRSFLFSNQIARHTKARKIVHIESDAYVLSQALFNLILDFNSGWLAPWLPKYRMPETAIQVITEDQFDVMLKIENDSRLNKEMAEDILPFTHIPREILGDRYSEFKRNRWIFRSRKFDRLFTHNFFFEPIPADADFATQVTQRQLADPRFKIPKR